MYEIYRRPIDFEEAFASFAESNRCGGLINVISIYSLDYVYRKYLLFAECLNCVGHVCGRRLKSFAVVNYLGRIDWAMYGEKLKL